MSARLHSWLTPLAIRAIHVSARVLRPLTLGVRAVILDERGWIFLVKHSYVAGWHCPGGAVETGETTWDALRREVLEEANIAVDGDPVLHGILFNGSVSKRDHVLVYVVRQFRILGERAPDWEIRESGFFDPDRLPDDATEATRRRLREVRLGAPTASDW